MVKYIHQVSSFQALRALLIRSDGQRTDLFRVLGLCLDKACTSQNLRVLPLIPSLIRGDGQHVETLAIERKIVCSFFVHFSCFSCVQYLETSYLHGTGECWHMSRVCFSTSSASSLHFIRFFATMLLHNLYCFLATRLFHSQACFFATMLFHSKYSRFDEVRGLVTILCSSLCSFSSHEPRCPTEKHRYEPHPKDVFKLTFFSSKSCFHSRT